MRNMSIDLSRKCPFRPRHNKNKVFLSTYSCVSLCTSVQLSNIHITHRNKAQIALVHRQELVANVIYSSHKLSVNKPIICLIYVNKPILMS